MNKYMIVTGRRFPPDFPLRYTNHRYITIRSRNGDIREAEEVWNAIRIPFTGIEIQKYSHIEADLSTE